MDKIKQALEAEIAALKEDRRFTGHKAPVDERINSLRAALAELEAAKPKWDADEWFRTLIEGMELRTHPDRPHVNLWDGLINGERVTLFDQDRKTGIVLYRWKYMGKVLEDNYSSSSAEVQAMLKRLLEEHLKWRVETTVHCHTSSRTMVEITSSSILSPPPWFEEHLKWRV